MKIEKTVCDIDGCRNENAQAQHVVPVYEHEGLVPPIWQLAEEVSLVDLCKNCHDKILDGGQVVYNSPRAKFRIREQTVHNIGGQKIKEQIRRIIRDELNRWGTAREFDEQAAKRICGLFSEPEKKAVPGETADRLP